MLYPQYFIDDLRNRADIVRIVDSYVPLKKKGANWMACCPFHQEKTPSFGVNPSKGLFKCFGCGKGGNVYTFVMELEGVGFPEAVKIVADRTGVMLPEPVDDQQYQRTKKKREEQKQLADQIIELNSYALEFWEYHLIEETSESKKAREYLDSRGISEEVRRTFRIGYAPDAWDLLIGFLKQKGADEKLIERSGLVSTNEEKKRTFDRFRGRVIFPVLDANGRPVAFGARILDKGEPKYLNSPETAAYIKGQHLYGLFQSKAEIRRKKFAILTEGYLDLIALYQAGITNVVASLGTAFTPEQAKLLGRFARKIVVNYDGDGAGIKAARRAIETLLAEEFEIKVLVLPDGSDPDDHIRTHGAESYNLLRGQAAPYLRFVLENSVRDRDLTVPKQKAEAIEDVAPVLSAVRNPIQKRESFDQAMTFLRVEDAGLRKDLWKSVKENSSVPADLRKSVVRARKVRVTLAEQRLLELLTHDAELRGALVPHLEETDYVELASASVFRGLIQLHGEGKPLTAEAMAEFVEEESLPDDFLPMVLLAEPARAAGDVIDEVLAEAENCLATLRTMAISRRIIELSQDLAVAEQEGDTELRDRLVSEQIKLARLKLQLERAGSSAENAE